LRIRLPVDRLKKKLTIIVRLNKIIRGCLAIGYEID
jgi:hypothetical protein